VFPSSPYLAAPPPAPPAFYDEPSIPGKFYAKFLNNCLIFMPALALHSINITSNSLARA